MLKPVFALGALAVLAMPMPSRADWSAYQSDSFTVYSNARPREALRMVEDFEIFRKVTFMLFELPDEPESERLKIFVFDRNSDFRRISTDPLAIGFFFHSVYGPRMIVGPQSDDETRETLYHEYVHYLMNHHFNINYPRWYSEGIAELLSTFEINASTVVVGKMPAYGIWNPATITQVVNNEITGALSAFYQTSWLMVHDFLIESYEDPTRARQTVEYIRRYDAGEDPVEAFVASYGMTMREMRDQLNLMRQNSTFSALTLQRPVYEGGVTERALDPGEELYLLGDLAMELEEHESAYEFFDEFDELGISSALAQKVTSRRSIGLAHQDAFGEGDVLVDALLASEPGDSDVIADIAHYAFDRFVYAVEQSEPRAADHLRRSIDFGERAVAQNPGDLEALFYLGRAYELNGEIQRAVDTLLLSYDINPSVSTLNLTLARVLIKGRQLELASYLLSRVYSATHSEESRAKIKEIQLLLEDEDFDIASIEGLL